METANFFEVLAGGPVIPKWTH